MRVRKNIMILSLLLIAFMSIMVAVLITHPVKNVPVTNSSIPEFNATVVPGFYLQDSSVYFVYFRPIQYVIVQGITYKPEYGNQPPNGVFKFENVTVLNISQNVTLKIVVDGVAQNLTLPVFHGAVGVPATGTLVPVNSSS